MHIHIIHRTRPLRHASTLLSTRTTHVKIVKIVRSRSSGVSHGASGYTKRNQFGSKLRIFEYLRMLRKCHREAMFSWASPIFTCLLHGGVSQMTCCIFVFSEQQRPIQHAGVNKKWKKWQGQEEKTCPADGPALRARKAQSTGEAKRPGQNKFWQNASYPPWIWIDSQLAKQAGILVYSFWHRLQNLHKPPQPQSV